MNVSTKIIAKSTTATTKLIQTASTPIVQKVIQFQNEQDAQLALKIMLEKVVPLRVSKDTLETKFSSNSEHADDYHTRDLIHSNSSNLLENARKASLTIEHFEELS